MAPNNFFATLAPPLPWAWIETIFSMFNLAAMKQLRPLELGIANYLYIAGSDMSKGEKRIQKDNS